MPAPDGEIMSSSYENQAQSLPLGVKYYYHHKIYEKNINRIMATTGFRIMCLFPMQRPYEWIKLNINSNHALSSFQTIYKIRYMNVSFT